MAPDGQRWGATYDRHMEETAKVVDSKLIMKPIVEEGPGINVFNRNHTVGDTTYPYGDLILSMPYHTTASREWSEKWKRQVPKLSHKPWLVRPGSLVRARVDFSRMDGRNLRHSLWLMPFVLNRDFDKLMAFYESNGETEPPKLAMSDSYDEVPTAVSYTHLTLPTIYSV